MLLLLRNENNNALSTSMSFSYPFTMELHVEVVIGADSRIRLTSLTSWSIQTIPNPIMVLPTLACRWPFRPRIDTQWSGHQVLSDSRWAIVCYKRIVLQSILLQLPRAYSAGILSVRWYISRVLLVHSISIAAFAPFAWSILRPKGREGC